VEIVRDRQTERLDVIRNEIMKNYPDRTSMPATTADILDENRATNALQFAVRLWLHLSLPLDFPSSLPIPSLTEWVKDQLPVRVLDSTFIPGQLSKDFSMTNLFRVGGMGVVWEDDISKHLQLDDDKNIHVFRHSAALSAIEYSATR
jgi:hypothetical protein